jgi:hypothetical protein
MALDSNIVGGASNAKADVISAYLALKVTSETNAAANPANVGTVRTFAENDAGAKTGAVLLRSPEVDVDYRQRISTDLLLDDEVFNYTAQNTGKHAYLTTTLVNSWAAGQMTTNSGSITTLNTGTVLSTYACFPMLGTTTLSSDFELGFSAQPQTNSIIEFGVGVPSTALVAPSDGVFFRLTSAGLQGIASFNGTETSTGIFPATAGTGTFAYINSQRYQFICYSSTTEAQFWVNDGTGAVSLGVIPQPAAQSRMFMSSGVQAFVKHRIGAGAAGGVLQCIIGAYSVRLGGASATTTTPSTSGSRIFGSYQGLGGGTLGGLATYPNSTNPIAAAPSNTALTANLPAGLGGQGLVTAAVTAATDGIWASYQVPTNTVNIQGRRLVLRGIRLDLVNTGAAVATTATTVQFSLAYGHTNVSLATAEGASSKAPRRIALGFATWAVGAGIGAQPQSSPVYIDLGDAPIFVNPSEFIALVGKFIVGTATASQAIQFTYQPIYGWE